RRSPDGLEDVLQHVVATQRSTVFVGEDVAAVLPKIAEPVAIALLGDLPGDERADRLVFEINAPLALFGLRLLLFDPAVDDRARPSHCESAGREVDVDPSESCQLGRAQPGEHRYFEDD